MCGCGGACGDVYGDTCGDVYGDMCGNICGGMDGDACGGMCREVCLMRSRDRRLQAIATDMKPIRGRGVATVR